MGNVTILFSRSPKIGSYLIRKVTHSEWSHSAFLKNGYVTEAVLGGVREIPLEEFLSHHTHVVKITINITCSDLKACVIADQQKGKDYDWTAIFGIYFGRDWQEDDAWFCSELVAYILSFIEDLAPYIAVLDKDKVTPQQLFVMLVDLGVLSVLK